MFWIGLICGVLIGIVIMAIGISGNRREGNYIPRTKPSPTSPPPKPRK